MWSRRTRRRKHELLEALPRNRRRGSHPRCLLLMEGDKPAVAGRLTDIVGLDGVHIGEDDLWMPQGLPIPTGSGEWDRSGIREPRLGRDKEFLLEEDRSAVKEWWLAVSRGNTNTPNWDIASTATIDGHKGLILVEAKAHSKELKAKDRCASRNPQNQARIAAAIQEASEALEAIVPGWNLSPESCYQLANRFAWSWKIASLGMPVILIYLGFLCAEEMGDRGDCFADAGAWESLVRAYSQDIVPEAAWNRRLMVQDTPLWVLLRTREVEFSVQ